MLRSHKLIAPVALAAAATVALAGCSSGSTAGSGSRAAGPSSGASSASSGSSKPADAQTFVTDSLDAFVAAKSAHVSGSFSDTSADGEVAVDISYGDDIAIGTLTVKGQEIEISKPADGKTYFKAGADFWTSSGAPADAAATLADKYVEVTSTTEGFSDFAKLLDRQEFVDGVKPDDSELDGAKVTGPKDVNGVSCYGIEDSSGGGAYYAAAEGEPYPVQLTSEGDGKLDFDGYDTTVDVPTPPASDVVQLPTS